MLPTRYVIRLFEVALVDHYLGMNAACSDSTSCYDRCDFSKAALLSTVGSRNINAMTHVA